MPNSMVVVPPVIAASLLTLPTPIDPGAIFSELNEVEAVYFAQTDEEAASHIFSYDELTIATNKIRSFLTRAANGETNKIILDPVLNSDIRESYLSGRKPANRPNPKSKLTTNQTPRTAPKTSLGRPKRTLPNQMQTASQQIKKNTQVEVLPQTQAFTSKTQSNFKTITLPTSVPTMPIKRTATPPNLSQSTSRNSQNPATIKTHPRTMNLHLRPLARRRDTRLTRNIVSATKHRLILNHHRTPSDSPKHPSAAHSNHITNSTRIKTSFLSTKEQGSRPPISLTHRQ